MAQSVQTLLSTLGSAIHLTSPCSVDVARISDTHGVWSRCYCKTDFVKQLIVCVICDELSWPLLVPFDYLFGRQEQHINWLAEDVRPKPTSNRHPVDTGDESTGILPTHVQIEVNARLLDAESGVEGSRRSADFVERATPCS